MNRTSEANCHRTRVQTDGRGDGGDPNRILFSAKWGGALLLFLYSLIFASRFVPFGADLYDEGLIANGSALTLHGQFPGVSFYAPYPPGVFCLLALLFRVCGVRLIVERWFAAVLAALVAAIGFLLVAGVNRDGEMRPARQLAVLWVLGLAASLLLSSRWMTPVNGGALLLALASGTALQAFLPAGRVVGACACGALLGLTTLWRLDFGLYAAAATGVVWCLFAGHASGAKITAPQRVAGAGAMALATLAVAAPPLAWIVVRGGPRAADSLFWWPITSTGSARLPWTHHWSAFLMPLASVLLAARAAPTLRRRPADAAMTLWLLILGGGFLVYALGRTHATHLLPLRVVALLLAALSLTPESASASVTSRLGALAPHPSAGRTPFEMLVVLTIFASTSIGPVREYLKAGTFAARRQCSLPGSRGKGVYPPRHEALGYQWVVGYLQEHLPEGGRLYCGAPRHDLFLKDDNLAYFLSDRLPGTYYWCLDAGVTSSIPVQREMIRELAASHTDLVLIRTDCINRERNAGSRSSGVHLLDQHLHDHFQLADERGHYQVYRSAVGDDPSRIARKSEEELLPGQHRVVVAGHLGLVR